MAATSVPTSTGQQQHGSNTTSSSNYGNIGQQCQAQSNVYSQVDDNDDVQQATSNIELDGDRVQTPNTEPTSYAQLSREQLTSTTAVSTPPASEYLALSTSMLQPDTASNYVRARHVLHTHDGNEHAIDSAVDEAPYEGLNSPAEAVLAAEYADVGQAQVYDDISEYQGSSYQQLHISQPATTTVLMERRRKVTLAIVAGVMCLVAIVIFTTAVVAVRSGKQDDHSLTQSRNDPWAPVTSKPQCPDSMPLSVRYKSNITLPESVQGASIQSLSVSADGIVMVGLWPFSKLYLYKVEGSITYSCFVHCDVDRTKLAVWTPRGDIMCLSDQGNTTVVRPSGLVTSENANRDFKRLCSTTRIRFAIIVKDAQDLYHASVSLHGVPAIYVTYLFKGIYQSTDEGATWRHIELMSHVPGLNKFYYVFRISTSNHTDQLWIFGEHRHVPCVRLVTLNNGSFESVRNLSKPLSFNPGAEGIDYNYPSHILHSDQSNFVVQVMSVNRKQTHCQIQLTNSVGRSISFTTATRVYSLIVYKQPGTNNTTLYVGLDFGRILEYALLAGG